MDDRILIHKLIDEFIIYPEKSVFKYGDVSTPDSIRKQMIDLIPIEFFNNPNVKVLEPSAGKGLFIGDLLSLFMKYLPESYRSHKYILENIIWFADINDVNIFIIQKLYNYDNQYKLNYFLGDTLSWNHNIKFDLILSNPPYNAANSKNCGRTLYQKFTEKSIEWLSPDGLLITVHPPMWRVNNPCYDNIRQNYHLQYLSIHGIHDGSKYFKKETRYDVIKIKKSEPGLTNVRSIDGINYTVNIENFPNFLPNGAYDTIRFGTTNVINGKVVKPGTKYKYVKNIHKSDVIYCYSDIPPNPSKKVIISRSSGNKVNNVVVDLTGDIGFSSANFAILVDTDEQANTIKNYLLSDFNKILPYITFSNYELGYNVIKHMMIPG